MALALGIAEKILSEHLVSGELEPGNEIAIKIDHTLTQDATGTMAFLQFEAMGLNKVRNELAVSYVDHNTIQSGPENADDHQFLRTAAAKYGAVFSRPGNGICHQLHLERFGAPGKTLLGSDSHTPTAGGLGMIAIGAGGLDVAVAMGGGPFYLSSPEIVKIELKGKLRPWVSAKDVILEILRRFGVKGNVGRVFEYGGPGVKNLDVPERATITNMGAECGVTTSVFPSDEVTRSFLEAQGRGDTWRELVADEGAKYEKVEKLDLSTVEPLAAAPHSPGNIKTIASLQGMKVDQVLIGSCTNSSYCDLKRVARILEGKTISSGVSLGIAPGSRQVLGMLSREGLVTTLIDSGARILENACGFCIGNSMSPADNAVSLRTSNRNFEGRSGTRSAGIYLVSPEVAALAAIHGRIVDPFLTADLKYPAVRKPREFLVNDVLFLQPPKDGSTVTVVKGPGIGEVPVNDPLPNALEGEIAIKVGDDITTDHIMPAGARLKFRSNIRKYAEFVFEGVDPDFSRRAANTRDAGRHNVIVAGDSYGQGSSREHAALCPMTLGVKAVVAKSVERIHRANLINFGIVPFEFERKSDYDKVEQGDTVVIEGLRTAVEQGSKAELVVNGKNAIALKTDLSERERRMLVAGGMANMVAGKGGS